MSEYREFKLCCCKCGKEIGKIESKEFAVDAKTQLRVKAIYSRGKNFFLYCLDCDNGNHEKSYLCKMNKVINQIKEEIDYSYADFSQYAEEYGIDEQYDCFYYRGLERAIQILHEGGFNSEKM